MKKRVYVAGPMALGDRTHNLRQAIDAAEALMNAGLVPFVPQVHYAWGDVYQHTHEEWLVFDFEWLNLCDYLLRLPGESVGAEMEVDFATKRGIPVYYSAAELLEAWGAK